MITLLLNRERSSSYSLRELLILALCGTTKLTFDEVNKWIGSVQSEVKLQKDFTNIVKDKRQSELYFVRFRIASLILPQILYGIKP